MTHPADDSPTVAAVASGLIVAAGAVLVPVRSTVGTTNIALILVALVVLAAAWGGRLGGAVAALTASMTFNFFHTEPYRSLHIRSGRDVLTVALLLTVGLAVGELGVARARQSAVRRSHLTAMHSLEQLAAAMNDGRPTDEIWPVVARSLTDLLGVRHAMFRRTDPPTELAYIQRDGRLSLKPHRVVGDGFTLPAEGVTLPVERHGRPLGHILLDPDPQVGTTREQRRAAVAVADQFAIAISNEEHHA